VWGFESPPAHHEFYLRRSIGLCHNNGENHDRNG
jgi:hypothetical protein